MSGGDRRLGLGGTQLMEQAPLGTPEPAPPRAPGTQLIAQSPEPPGPQPNAVPLHGAPPPPQGWPEPQLPPQAPAPPQNFDFANAVPAYGIPPQALQNAPQQPPFQPPPPQAPNPYAVVPQTFANPYVQNAHSGASGVASSSNALTSRLKGGAILLVGLALLAFNAFLIFTQDYFYPKTLIIAFPTCWVGFFTVLAGKPVKPGTGQQPGWWLIGMYVGAFFALVAGVIAAIFITD